MKKANTKIKNLAEAFGKGFEKIFSNKRLRKIVLIVFIVDLLTTVLGGVDGVILYFIMSFFLIAYIGEPTIFDKNKEKTGE